MHRDADVIIVGAGPSGCAAAITLARQGYRVLVIDRARFPRDKPCGDYCDPGAVVALDALGCLAPVRRAGASPIDGMRIVGQDGTAIHPRFPTGQGLLIRRLVLDAELVACAARAGAEVVDGTPVLDVTPTNELVSIRTDRRGSLTAALVIVCDGMHSPIGRRLGLLADISPRRYTIGAYFSGVEGPPQGELHLGDGRYCGVARFGDGTANVCMALPREVLRRGSPDQVFGNALRAFPKLADELAGARRESPYRSAGPIGFRTNRAVAGRVLLAGDAAAQIDPMTGQGIFFALRSGMLAAETAAAWLSDRTALTRLTSYPHRRRALFAPKLRAARILQRLALRPRLTPWLLHRLDARPRLAGDLIGVTGDVLPASAMLNPGYVMQLLTGAGAHAPRA